MSRKILSSTYEDHNIMASVISKAYLFRKSTRAKTCLSVDCGSFLVFHHFNSIQVYNVSDKKSLDLLETFWTCCCFSKKKSKTLKLLTTRNRPKEMLLTWPGSHPRQVSLN
ncbi:hypothetical protein ACOSP7_018015 [Xanthoceras sorbifolium]